MYRKACKGETRLRVSNLGIEQSPPAMYERTAMEGVTPSLKLHPRLQIVERLGQVSRQVDVYSLGLRVGYMVILWLELLLLGAVSSETTMVNDEKAVCRTEEHCRPQRAITAALLHGCVSQRTVTSILHRLRNLERITWPVRHWGNVLGSCK